MIAAQEFVTPSCWAAQALAGWISVAIGVASAGVASAGVAVASAAWITPSCWAEPASAGWVLVAVDVASAGVASAGVGGALAAPASAGWVLVATGVASAGVASAGVGGASAAFGICSPPVKSTFPAVTGVPAPPWSCIEGLPSPATPRWLFSIVMLFAPVRHMTSWGLSPNVLLATVNPDVFCSNWSMAPL